MLPVMGVDVVRVDEITGKMAVPLIGEVTIKVFYSFSHHSFSSHRFFDLCLFHLFIKVIFSNTCCCQIGVAISDFKTLLRQSNFKKQFRWMELVIVRCPRIRCLEPKQRKRSTNRSLEVRSNTEHLR